jgi:hypothetical protein
MVIREGFSREKSDVPLWAMTIWLWPLVAMHLWFLYGVWCVGLDGPWEWR